MAPKPLSPDESRAAGAAAWRVAGLGMAIYAASKIAAILLQSMSMPAAVAQAVIAEWGAGYLGIAWSDPTEPVATLRSIARRAGVGASVGLVSAAVVVLFLAVTRAVALERSSPAASMIVVGLLMAGLYAMRDELILHGLVMRALVTVEAPALKVLACGLTSAAAAYGELGGSAPRAVLAQGLLGVVFGALWVRDRGAWPAWAAHAAWLFTTGLLMQGGLFEARVAATSWGGADAGPIGGTAALVALLPLAAGALVGTARIKRRPT